MWSQQTIQYTLFSICCLTGRWLFMHRISIVHSCCGWKRHYIFTVWLCIMSMNPNVAQISAQLWSNVVSHEHECQGSFAFNLLLQTHVVLQSAWRVHVQSSHNCSADSVTSEKWGLSLIYGRNGKECIDGPEEIVLSPETGISVKHQSSANLKGSRYKTSHEDNTLVQCMKPNLDYFFFNGKNFQLYRKRSVCCHIFCEWAFFHLCTCVFKWKVMVQSDVTSQVWCNAALCKSFNELFSRLRPSK